jgi:hypothetical protein
MCPTKNQRMLHNVSLAPTSPTFVPKTLLHVHIHILPQPITTWFLEMIGCEVQAYNETSIM